MRALIHDPEAPAGLRLDTAPDPVPGPGQVLVEVRATALNFGEVKYLAAQRQPGEVSGWDAAGVVVQAAADGSGPSVGSRVVTFGWSGGWGGLRVVDVDELAVVPESVDLGAASGLPVAGVTALRAVRRLGPVVGRRVLVTGASGGVGRFAVQLAARAGAWVVASVGSEARGEGLIELGAGEIVVGLDKVTDPVFGVLDNVGGQQLAQAFALLEEGGSAQAIGKASGEATTIDFEEARIRGFRTSIEPFFVGPKFGPDLAYLVDLLDKGQLDPQIGWRGDWSRASEAAKALLARKINGKAILDIT
ncbi:zinc-binding dehydrogenase [Pseudonocardia spinosispora]|uniref:zinc-binding dehydrogenase n=1 Tax=Pseudonocardia spinosispora TaxID=103441 RepID=UPI00048D5EE9|nr:zinc-binding dehydrogenase [Pseudonocardia spinosispora]